MSNVTDRMVEAAWKAYVKARDGKPMRAAIEAALREQPAPEPVATVAENATTQQPVGDMPPSNYRRGYLAGFEIGKREGRIAAEDAAKQAEPVEHYASIPGTNVRVRLQPESAQEPVAQAMRDAAVYGVGISRDGKRIDPASIYAQQAEPVAWRWTESNGKHWFDWSTDWNHHDRAKDMGFPTQYAYTAAPQQRKPLTEEEIESIWRQKPRWHAPPIGTTDIEFARAVEQAHGIGDSDE